MIRKQRILAAIAVLCVCVAAAVAQSPEGTPPDTTLKRNIQAVGYQVGGGGTTIDMRGTDLAGGASGEAKVEAKSGITNIELKAKGLESPTKIGSEFLTYVVWVVSPDGRASNVGELLTDAKGEGKLKATTQLQTFALFVTAEPYFAV